MLLIQNRYRPSLLFSGLAIIYYVIDLIDFKSWMQGYISSPLLTLMVLMIVSFSLEKTFMIKQFSSMLIGKNYLFSLVKISFLVPIYSAFLNNTAVVASLLGGLANNRHHKPSKLLIPLSYVTIFGGTITLVGTSTNMVINSFVVQNGLSPLSLFDFFYVGSLVSLFGGLTILLFSQWLPSYDVEQFNEEDYLIETMVTHHSLLIGKSIAENKLRHLEYLFLTQIQRGDTVLSPVSPEEKICEGDILIFSGNIKHIDILKKFDGLALHASGSQSLKHNLQTTHLIDVIVAPDSDVCDRSVKEINFRSRFDATIVSIKRGRENIQKIGETQLMAGDKLILAVGKDFDKKEANATNFYILSDVKIEKKLTSSESWIVFSSFFSVIVFSAFGIISLFKGMLLLFILHIMLGIIKFDEIKRRFPIDIFLIIGASLAIGKVFTDSGLAKDIATVIIESFGTYGMYGSFIGIYIFTALLTDVITNNAAAALAFPIAYSMALALGVSPLPFIFAVAYGASASFLSPYTYQTNLMVCNVAGYKFTDFMKLGLPVSLVYGLVVILCVPLFFPF